MQTSDTTLPILAASVANAINQNATLLRAGLAATSNANAGVVYLSAPPQFGIVSTSVAIGGTLPTETITNVVSGKISIAGTPTTGDRVNTTFTYGTTPGTTRNVQYTVAASDTNTTTLAASVANAINSDAVLTAAGIRATSIGPLLSITSTGTVTISSNTNGVVTESIAGTPQQNNVVSITVYNSGLAGGQKTESYTVQSGDTLSTIANNLRDKINTDMTALGITATSSGTSPAVVTITSTSTSTTLYSQNVLNSGMTITQAGGPAETANSGTATGGGRLHTADNSAMTNSTASYNYDAIGRVTNRSINGPANSTTWAYDAMSRITSEANLLGTFNYTYIDDTPGSSKGCLRLSSIAYPNSQTTSFAWLPNIGDQRLQQIKNLNPSAALLSQFNYAYNAAGAITQWQQQQNSTNTHLTLGYDLAAQLISAQSDSGSTLNVYVSGTPHTNDVVSITAYDASLTGTNPVGQETASHTVTSGQTLANIASSLASQINSAMTNIGVTATANSNAVITINTSATKTTQFTVAVTGTGATTTISIGGSNPIQPLHKQLYYAYDCASNRTGVQGDSTGSFPSGLTTTATKYTYNNLNQLTSASAGGPIKFQGATVNPIKSAVVNVTQTATIGGTITAGDKLTLIVHDKGLSQAENITYQVQSGDSVNSIAANMVDLITNNSTLSNLNVTASNSGPVITISSSSVNATLYTTATTSGATETITLGGSAAASATITPSQAFSASPVLISGSNTAKVTAVSGGGTSATNSYPVTINSSSAQSFTYDANGNMTADGTNTYAWDAENRLIKITYPGTGNDTQFSFDGLSKTVKIIEQTSGSTTSTKQFVWCSNQLCESRDASSALSNQYFRLGQVNFIAGVGTNFYSALDHLGSIHQLTNSAGTTQAEYTYNPYGVRTVISETVPSAFGYAGYYFHSRSGLNLTMFREYNAGLGRWLSRDPLGERFNNNLYNYVDNQPTSFVDLLGLWRIRYDGPHPVIEFPGPDGTYPTGTAHGYGPVEGTYSRPISQAHGNYGPGPFGLQQGPDDETMLQAITLVNASGRWRPSGIDFLFGSGNPNNYYCFGHNCQNWLEDVLKKHDELIANPPSSCPNKK